MMIIGSTAALLRGIYFDRRPPPDMDVIGTQAELDILQSQGYEPVVGKSFRLPGNPTIIDFEVAAPRSSADAYLHAGDGRTDKAGEGCYEVATLPILYSLKRSHRHMPKAWHKHIRDYHQLKHRVGGVDSLHLITEQREREYLAKATPALRNKTAAEFFDDTVSNKVFVHDDIHLVMAHDDRPMFERIRKSPDTVDCSRQKWDQLSVGDRVCCVLEEAYVIALERAVIPMVFSGGRRVDPVKALQWAIMRICTTLCSGWFRDFATEHYLHLEAALDLEYHLAFFKAVDEGRIRRIGQQER
jgi:hypothetical protein